MKSHINDMYDCHYLPEISMIDFKDRVSIDCSRSYSIKTSKTISEWVMYVTAYIPSDIYCVALPTTCWQLPLEIIRYCYVVTADAMILSFVTEPFVGSIHVHNIRNHDDVIKWKHFPRYWPFVWGIHRSPVNSPYKGLWRGALMVFLSVPE